MKTRSGWLHLRGLFLLSVGFALGFVLCDSAFAGPTTATRVWAIAKVRTIRQPPAQKKVYLVLTSASAIPQPIEWVTGIPTTATPMDIFGRGPAIGR